MLGGTRESQGTTLWFFLSPPFVCAFLSVCVGGVCMSVCVQRPEQGIMRFLLLSAQPSEAGSLPVVCVLLARLVASKPQSRSCLRVFRAGFVSRRGISALFCACCDANSSPHDYPSTVNC